MASSRRTGTNEQITTYDSAGGKDYSTLGAWETATDTDHVGDAETDVLECYKGAHNDGNVTLIGGNNNAAYHRIIRPASGEGHSGIPKSDGSIVEFHYDADTSYLLRLAETSSKIQDLVMTRSVNSTSTRQAFYMHDDATDGELVGCLIYNMSNSGSASTRAVNGTPTNSAYYINCLFFDGDGDGARSGGGTNYFYNCTCVSNAGIGMDGSSSASNIAKNVCSSGNGDVDFDSEWTKTTCTADSGDSPTYISEAGDDLHLDSSDTVAKGNGTDLSADANFAFDDDIDRDIISDWPIGFDEPQLAYVPYPRMSGMNGGIGNSMRGGIAA